MTTPAIVAPAILRGRSHGDGLCGACVGITDSHEPMVARERGLAHRDRLKAAAARGEFGLVIADIGLQ